MLKISAELPGWLETCFAVQVWALCDISQKSLFLLFWDCYCYVDRRISFCILTDRDDSRKPQHHGIGELHGSSSGPRRTNSSQSFKYFISFILSTLWFVLIIKTLWASELLGKDFREGKTTQTYSFFIFSAFLLIVVYLDDWINRETRVKGFRSVISPPALEDRGLH